MQFEWCVLVRSKGLPTLKIKPWLGREMELDPEKRKTAQKIQLRIAKNTTPDQLERQMRIALLHDGHRYGCNGVNRKVCITGV